MKLYSRLVIYQFETNDIISLKCQARQSTCNDRNYAYIKSAVQNGNGWHGVRWHLSGPQRGPERIPLHECHALPCTFTACSLSVSQCKIFHAIITSVFVAISASASLKVWLVYASYSVSVVIYDTKIISVVYKFASVTSRFGRQSLSWGLTAQWLHLRARLHSR